MKIHSSSTHHYADGEVGEVLSPQNTLGVSGGNRVAAESNTIEVNGDLHLRRIKTTQQTYNASLLLVWCHPGVSKYEWNLI